MLSLFYLVLVCACIILRVAPEGISHSSHLMLLAAEKGETKKVIDYITITGVPINVKNNYGVRLVRSNFGC